MFPFLPCMLITLEYCAICGGFVCFMFYLGLKAGLKDLDDR